MQNLNQAVLEQALERLGVPAVHWYEKTGSSNDDALRWASEGAPDFALVAAGEQTTGRGRLGRKWFTPPGQTALAFSLILRPSAEEQANLALFSALGAVALRAALEETCQVAAEIKWPNDILIRRKKAAGILAESAWAGSVLETVVIGIGINIAPQSVPPADEVLFPATSVEGEAGRPVDRLELLAEVVQRMRAWRELLGKPEFVAEWESKLAFRGEWVRIEQKDAPALEGKVIGVAPDGQLRLQTKAGGEVRVMIGDLHVRPLERQA
jgi:BirA family biotin operon repressor/biotin-[acetyl-CoA-carboxylase] ligase